MPHKALAEALLAHVQSGEGIPISVKVTPSDEVLRLRKRIEELEADVKFWKQKLDQCEFQLGNEIRVSDNLVELLRANNIKIPRSVFKTR